MRISGDLRPSGPYRHYAQGTSDADIDKLLYQLVNLVMMRWPLSAGE
ncbi:hypothetical protein [Morganella morganii]|nr:hypothetical protein [Morganella morganii]